VVLAAMVFGGLAAADGALEEPPEEPPFVFAEPSIGEVMEYMQISLSASSDGDRLELGDRHPRVYTWAQPMDAADAFGRIVQARPLDATSGVRLLFLPDGALFAKEYKDRWDTYRRWYAPGEPMEAADCLLHAPAIGEYQGGRIDVACHAGGQQEGLTLAPVGPAGPREGRTYTFDVLGLPGRAQVTFKEGLSTPVQYVWLAEEVIDGRRHGMARILSRHAPGEEAYPATAGPPPQPEIRLAERTPWTVDDSASTHGFPLSAAYAAAEDEMGDYLSAHPRAVLMHADPAYGTEVDWSFSLSDGQAALHVRVKKQPSPLPPIEDTGLIVTDATVRSNPAVAEGPFALDPADVPATLPPLGILEERLRRLGLDVPPDLPARMWIRNDCEHPCDQARIRLYVAFGSEAENHAPRMTGDDAPTGFWSAAFLPDGRMAAWVVEAPVLEPEPAGPMADPGAPAAAFRTHEATHAALWHAPAAGEVARMGVLAVLFGAVVLLWPLLRSGLAVPLFSRIEGPDVARHPVRKRILEAVETSPGLHFQALRRTVGVPNGSAVHHVGKLTEAGLLIARSEGGYTCYFLPGRPDPVLAAAPLLASPGARAVWAALQSGPSGQAALADATGLGRTAVSHHVRRLREAGLVMGERDGRRRVLRLTDAGRCAAASL